ncbi:MAG TPA: hypothetical protein VEI97_11115, partial [bacterium]|nr:hypothetical protein [bacterium]
MMVNPVATPKGRERLRDAAMGGALTLRRLLRMAVLSVAILGIYAFLVFREVSLITAMEAGRAIPPGLTIVEPAAVAWREVPLAGAKGRPVNLAYDPSRGEFQVTFDSGDFLQVPGGGGRPTRRKLPFIPGPDLPIVVQPQIMANHWPATDGRHAFFLTSQNELVTVDLNILKVTRRQLALPEPSGAPHRFKSERCFWHVAHDPSTDRLILVIRDRATGNPLCMVQFQEPKRGFGTIQDFAVDGITGTMRYAVDGVPGVRELLWEEGSDHTLVGGAQLLPPAPFPAGSSAMPAAVGLPLRRLSQLGYGEATRVDQVPGATVALRPEVPMVSLVPDNGEESWSYFPTFAAMPDGGMVATGGPVVLVGQVPGAQAGEVTEL